ncbi:tRNA nucleotidyltransferase/poly(A) polymerase [Posidoniimonas polymericola]|uniref:tRNA nucleotidyltransferase/poly(A) polymerase n=1 Tax=Posidoniimonas polymericola TaxID=2528002 RepID=A0A5C5YPZ3_9BACT|nr:CCA tRNA nucleotidyltransferase [Posidoniimonas polymericola]TWT77032.1 tRNA nucleotidyltransferase/poly(A) polymerase [Posidoniimonas polymericola]
MADSKRKQHGDSHEAQRGFALDVVRTLRDAGHQSLWAGGCVRDQLLGKRPKDYDVATSATPEQVRGVFGMRRTLPIGAAFGVITVLGPKEAGQIEVATFRSDAGYSDGRRPDRVEFTDAQHDASRRDFTINGLFFDPLGEQVLDYVGGQQDLAAGVVRAIGDADARIEEDKLRMLRAVRFAATFAFELAPDTAAAVQRHAAEIGVVSAERIGAELARMLTHENRRNAVCMLRDLDLLAPTLPELAGLAAPEFDARCKTLKRLADPTLPLALAACLPRSTRSPAGGRLCRRLKFTGDDANQTDWLLDHCPVIEDARAVAWPKLQRVLAARGAEDALRLVDAEQEAGSPETEYCRARMALPVEQWNPPPLVDGGDLIAAGFQPGPEFGKLLEQIRDEQLEGRLDSKQAALDYLRSRDATSHNER